MLEASIRAKSIPPTLEFETALTSTLSQFLYTTMVDITAAVKYYLGNALGKCSLGYSLAYLAGSFLVAAEAFEALLHGRGAGQSYAVHIIDDLSVNMLGGAEYTKAWTLWCAAKSRSYHGGGLGTVVSGSAAGER